MNKCRVGLYMKKEIRMNYVLNRICRWKLINNYCREI